MANVSLVSGYGSMNVTRTARMAHDSQGGDSGGSVYYYLGGSTTCCSQVMALGTHVQSDDDANVEDGFSWFSPIAEGQIAWDLLSGTPSPSYNYAVCRNPSCT